ncbi:PREDICTED: uncharacterized protein LOC106742978 [Dinoponera quadriceps]|uniref:Uncharacterized protein LOC106742978 n=1 Tax=Dinoponera quadriceps TaxID=609295 RepID=A0A6P3X0L7_DINQU|nr:PREDICTED: uncharacterized protein LOC106742978 [Dinoponera quadriceps]
MTDNAERKEDTIDGRTEVKVEPTLRCYAKEEHENGFSNFENAIPSDVGTLNLWTSKATTCLISQYKKYRSMVGQSTQIRSLREMFEMISLEMQNNGFYFSPQKCENKWRVLERKYKNLVSRERLKKPGRMRHYGQWEHKRALDEIFSEKKKRVYLEENEPSGSVKYSSAVPKFDRGRQQKDPLLSNDATNERDEETPVQRRTLTIMFEKFLEEMGKNFALAEKNKEKRHKEEMAVRQKELELKNKLLTLKEQKIELQKCQVIAAAQNFSRK